MLLAITHDSQMEKWYGSFFNLPKRIITAKKNSCLCKSCKGN